jgi:hypothetical protein
VLFVLLCVPVADVCALAANGDAANPTAISAATKYLVLVMANPFPARSLSRVGRSVVERLLH